MGALRPAWRVTREGKAVKEERGFNLTPASTVLAFGFQPVRLEAEKITLLVFCREKAVVLRP